MSLRELAKADNKAILNDDVCGFGWPIYITSPGGIRKKFTGYGDDIAQIIDPETGTPVSGRLVSATLHIQDIIDVGFDIPHGVANQHQKPWLASFSSIVGEILEFKIRESAPDRMLGQVVFILEFYTDDDSI